MLRRRIVQPHRPPHLHDTPSLQARLISRGLRRLIKPRKVSRADIPLLRGLMFAFTRSRLPEGVQAERVKTMQGGAWLRGEWLRPQKARRGRALLYLHGGGYICGAPRTHRAITARLAKRLGVAVFALDYRLAPEHPNPAQLQDALRVYRALLASGVKRVAVAGDSAGGMLALRLLLALKERRLRRPEALALISPWTDFTLSGDSQRSHAARDPLLTASWLRQATFAFAGGMALPLPLLEADLSALPPTLIQVGSEEILLSDSERLAVRATTCGVPVTLRCYEGLWHDFQLHAGVFAPADAALDEMGGFLRAALDSRMSKAA